MRWIVGLDLRPRSLGALHFASWLGDATAPREPDTFVAVHVLEQEHLRAALKTRHLDEIEAAASTEARRTLDREDPGGRVTEVEIVQAVGADQGLLTTRAERKADGIIVGRIAQREERRLVRLGRVARRLLRDPGKPLLVVPPDLGPAAIGTGPVVALTSLEPEAVEACRFAADLARRTGRPLDVVHVVPHLAASSPEFIPVALAAERGEELIREGEKALAAWVGRLGLHPSRTHVIRGELFDAAVLHAEEVRAPLLVVGARRRGGLERLLSPSIASELAATSTVPVAVVPAAPEG
jgi:nucleotide-binding universal stress UspA family protein